MIIVNSVIFTSSVFAAKKSKYSISNFKANGVDYEYYKNKKGLWGLKKAKDEKWILKPQYSALYIRTDEQIYTGKPKDKFLKLYNSKTKKFQKTDFTSYFFPPYQASNTILGNIPLLQSKDRSVQAFVSATSSELNTIANLDENIVNEHQANLMSIYGTPYFGLFVRQVIDGKKIYQAYGGDGRSTGRKYSAEAVEFMMNDSFVNRPVNYLIPFEVIDKARNLYWPIIFVENSDKSFTFIERPDHIKGLVINPRYHWSDLYMNPKSLLKVPSFYELGVLHVDASGAETMMVEQLDISKLSKFFKVSDLLTKKIEQRTGNKYTDLFFINSKDITYDGRYYDRKYPAYKLENGKYTNAFMDLTSSDETFDTKELLIKNLELKAANIEQIANLKKQDYLKREYESQKIRAEGQQRMEAYFKDINDSNAEEKRNADAQRKAETNAIWSRVGQQIQQTGQEASKKAKCINKRTQTKKDYLAGKQGWYDVGGCQ
jgi:hypothetical protein